MRTRLTERLNIDYPVIQAPMAYAAGGALASAVSRAGGLGLIGGGLITWALREKPGLLHSVLSRRPAAIFLSFGDPAPYADIIHAAGALLICQVQTLKDAKHALEIGADIVVAQGSEAGGHGEGRGIVAALALGADGVAIGTRFWASSEALVHPNFLAQAVRATGDETIRTQVADLVRGLDWPERYDCRVVRNAFIRRWSGAENQLLSELPVQTKLWQQAQESGDTNIATAIVGEAIGLINDVPDAASILNSLMRRAESVRTLL